MLTNAFFNRDAQVVAKNLLGKVLRFYNHQVWLSVMIIETEAYYLREKASHSSLGCTPSRKAMFMPPGTIYMYYARGGDTLNISCRGAGNAVLIKSAVPYITDASTEDMVLLMQKAHIKFKPMQKLCSGQTLLCKSLGLKVPEWNQKNFQAEKFFIEDVNYKPSRIIQTTRLGIPIGRDEHLLYRYIDADFAAYCTNNPLTKRSWREGEHYLIHRIKNKK